MADRPRTFAELVAAMNPAERARLERAEHYDDHTIKHGADEIEGMRAAR
jgi:hypothetical protein